MYVFDGDMFITVARQLDGITWEALDPEPHSREWVKGNTLDEAVNNSFMYAWGSETSFKNLVAYNDDEVDIFNRDELSEEDIENLDIEQHEKYELEMEGFFIRPKE